MMSANRQYDVSVLVLNSKGYDNSAALVFVVVGTSEVAAINGGDRSVAEPLTLDSSASYDPDEQCAVVDCTADGSSCASTLDEMAVNTVGLADNGADTYAFT